MGYQSVVKDIEPGFASIVFDVALQIKELDELDVSSRVRFRRTDINLFWNTILGKNPSKRTIQATNPETVYYYYNSETKILKVTCREPLQIINYETGYHIQCVLDNFTHDYSTGITDWSYQTVFTELEPENIRQKTNWEAKREDVYKISLTKFIKSLYSNSLKNDGFVLADMRLNTDRSNPFTLTMLNQDDILSTVSTDNSKTFDLAKHQILLICYGRPVTDDDLTRLERAQYPDVRFDSNSGDGLGRSATSLTRSYQREQLDNNGLYRNLLHGESIRIFPDGTYENRFRMAPVNSSETLLGLSIRLPLEYIPEGSILSGTEIEAVAEDIQSWSANIFSSVDRRFIEQLNIFPQEKIHLHTDRNMYVSGEKIWFKAYVTDALTHQYPTNSRYVYVELISPADTLMYRVMVRPVDGMFYGHLSLTEYVPTGNYTLRAYTRYMENLGDDYFFKKNIRIENLSSAINQQRPTANRGMLKDDFSVSFFPEGGNLPEGVLSKVAFKAININGYPEIIAGKLIDENGVEITSVKSFYAGMGVFDYRPEAGKRIYLTCKNLNGLEKQFELPQPDIQAYSLTANQRENDLLIEIRHSVHAPDITCYLLAHCRGEVLYLPNGIKRKRWSYLPKNHFLLESYSLFYSTINSIH